MARREIGQIVTEKKRRENGGENERERKRVRVGERIGRGSERVNRSRRLENHYKKTTIGQTIIPVS